MKLGILTFHSQLNYVSSSRMRARRGGVRRTAVLGAEDGAGGQAKCALRAKNLFALTLFG